MFLEAEIKGLRGGDSRSKRQEVALRLHSEKPDRKPRAKKNPCTADIQDKSPDAPESGECIPATSNGVFLYSSDKR